MTRSRLPSGSRARPGTDPADAEVPAHIRFSCSACGLDGTVADVPALLAHQREHREQYGDSHVLEFDR
jgi:hypothetical protein